MRNYVFQIDNEIRHQQILDKKMDEFKNANQNDNIKNESNETDEFGKRRFNIFIDECVRLTMQRKCFTEKDVIIESLTMMSGVKYDVRPKCGDPLHSHFNYRDSKLMLSPHHTLF